MAKVIMLRKGPGVNLKGKSRGFTEGYLCERVQQYAASRYHEKHFTKSASAAHVNWCKIL